MLTQYKLTSFVTTGTKRKKPSDKAENLIIATLVISVEGFYQFLRKSWIQIEGLNFNLCVNICI